jgi:hypothetical protein
MMINIILIRTIIDDKICLNYKSWRYLLLAINKNSLYSKYNYFILRAKTMKIIPIAKIDIVNTIIVKALLKVWVCRITAKPYKLVKIKKIPSTYPSFLLNLDNSFFIILLIYEFYSNFFNLIRYILLKFKYSYCFSFFWRWYTKLCALRLNMELMIFRLNNE